MGSMLTNEELFLQGRHEELWEKNIGLIKHIAKKLWKYGLELDEIMSIAGLTFTKILGTYDPNKSVFTTYYGNNITYDVLKYVRYNTRHRAEYNNSISLNTVVNGDSSDKELTLESLIDSEGTDTQVDLDTDIAFKDYFNTLDDNRKKIIQLKARGYNQPQIQSITGISQVNVSRWLRQMKEDFKAIMRGDNPMGKKHKQQKAAKFMPPTVMPPGNPNTAAEMQRVRKALNEQRDKDNKILSNVIIGTSTVVLKEFFDFDRDKLEDFLEKTFEQINLLSKELVTEDQVIGLIKSYGLNIERDINMDLIGKLMNDKLKVYTALENGISEIGQLVKATGVSSKMCSALRWQWNKEKYGKDYEGEEIMATKQSIAFGLFDEGKTNKEVVKLVGSPVSSVVTWRCDWKKDRMSKLSTDGAASILSGEKTLIQALKDEGIIEQSEEVKSDIMEKDEELPIPAKAKTETTGDVRTEEDMKTKEEISSVVEPKEHKKSLFKKKVTLDGDMASYSLDGEYVDITIGDQVITMKPDELSKLANEMLAAVEEM